ncbi:uncharacterized protein LOC120628840 [Pararge aegeria]|uniref:uncharacterized protein LOC120628840 n=1 Tax=Pararge aegeria TaxID=116150 RepID=UPI0019CF8869|nr:uncharacterized protein LOC120628840 [Pararge aegeria]
MIKFMFVFFASALLVTGVPLFPSDLIDAVKNNNWDQFRALLNLNSFARDLPAVLSGSVESLQPSDGTHVYGHAVSAIKQWSNINGEQSEYSKGLEVENDDGKVTKRIFKP